MKAKYSMYDIREALRKEIAGALDESWLILDVEIPELKVKEGTYFVKGVFKVTPLFSATPRRKGKFEAKLNEDLKIISWKILKETQ
ncbi:MAG: hypothetical protein QW270_04895 [Candidatus Bathyarchaeia archaeon]